VQGDAILAMKRGKSVDFTGYWQRRIVGSDPRQSVMVVRKPLAEIAIYSVAMPATVGLCLWILLGPLRIDLYLGTPMPGLTKANSEVTAVPVPGDKADSETPTVILFPGDDGRLLAQMQRALVGKGYSVGPAGAGGNDATLAALEAFQSNNALPVQPKCDLQCRTALGLPDPQ
jgi:hypothetical protein